MSLIDEKCHDADEDDDDDDNNNDDDDKPRGHEAMVECILSQCATYHSIWSNVSSVTACPAFLAGILIGVPTFPPIIAAVAVKEPVIALVVGHLSCGGCNECENKVNIERMNNPGKRHFDGFKLPLLL